VAEAAANALAEVAVEAASVAVAGVDDEMSQLKWRLFRFAGVKRTSS
jgi:hypothetical protein